MWIPRRSSDSGFLHERGSRLDGFFHVEGVYHDMTEDDAEIKLTQVSDFVGNLCKFLELVFA